MKFIVLLLIILLSNNISASEWRKRPTKLLQQSFSCDRKKNRKEHDHQKSNLRSYCAYLAACYMVGQKED